MITACFCRPSFAHTPPQAQIARLTIEDGALIVHTRFRTQLNQNLIDALEQGVTLSFTLDFRLTRPMREAWTHALTSWFSPHAQIQYKLSYLPLSQHYRLYHDDLYQNYTRLNEALTALGSIRGWRVLPSEVVAGRSLDVFQGEVRLQLDRSQLARPFQLNTLNSQTWTVDSGWISLNTKGS